MANKQSVASETLNLRTKESYERLGFFLFDERAPAGVRNTFGRKECLMLLYRVVGGQKFWPNLRTVWYVIREYISYWIHDYEFRLWHWSQVKVYGCTSDEIESMLSGLTAEEMEEAHEIVAPATEAE